MYFFFVHFDSIKELRMAKVWQAVTDFCCQTRGNIPITRQLSSPHRSFPPSSLENEATSWEQLCRSLAAATSGDRPCVQLDVLFHFTFHFVAMDIKCLICSVAEHIQYVYIADVPKSTYVLKMLKFWNSCNPTYSSKLEHGWESC